MCDVVRRIGGRNSHPELHRVLANGGPYSDAGSQCKPGLVCLGDRCSKRSVFAVVCLRYAPGNSASCADADGFREMACARASAIPIYWDTGLSPLMIFYVDQRGENHAAAN